MTISGVDSMTGLTLDAETGVFEGAFDPALDSPSSTVIHCVAGLSERDPLELDPLYNVVDPGPLNELLSGGHTSVPVQTEFTYEGFEVTLANAGRIALRRTADASNEI